jgi:hypothetical protein
LGGEDATEKMRSLFEIRSATAGLVLLPKPEMGGQEKQRGFVSRGRKRREKCSQKQRLSLRLTDYRGIHSELNPQVLPIEILDSLFFSIKNLCLHKRDRSYPLLSMHMAVRTPCGAVCYAICLPGLDLPKPWELSGRECFLSPMWSDQQSGLFADAK